MRTSYLIHIKRTLFSRKRDIAKLLHALNIRAYLLAEDKEFFYVFFDTESNNVDLLKAVKDKFTKVNLYECRLVKNEVLAE